MDKRNIGISPALEFAETIILILAIALVVTLGVLTLPIWIIPYLVYKLYLSIKRN